MRNMKENQTIAYFIIKGISEAPELQAPIFVLVLFIYFTSLFGNLSLFLLVCFDTHLHTPMYFFLANLSLVDMTSSTVTLHKILLTFITGDNTTLYVACLMQSYMFGALLGHELFILTAMSFDRYVAICRPLNYNTIMNFKICLLLVSICWICGFINYAPFVWLIAKITCFSTNVIDHFACDVVPFIQNACSDVTLLARVSLIQGTVVYVIAPFLLILTSYIFIIRSIMKINSSIGRGKAFYTCSSHLIVIVLLYSALIFHYAIPENNLGSKKLYSLFNMAVVPMLNPFIYSLTNKDVKAAFRKRIWKCTENGFCCVIEGNVAGINKREPLC